MPARLGDYLLVRRLGRGGMGVVHEGRHVESSARVALKSVVVPRADMVAGIRREIAALARLRHPGIVRVVDHGMHEGLPWYAMELVSGITLRERITELWEGSAGDASGRTDLLSAGGVLQGPTARLDPEAARQDVPATPAGAGELSPEKLADVLTLVHELCGTLAHLHGHGIVHRDLKPENVILRSDGSPVLVDFGLAASAASGIARERLEVGGAVIGSVGYMAPEQARGELVDARADLYSLGAILHELLTGAPPFTGATLMELLHKVQSAAPVAPSAVVAGVPAELDALVLGMLEKDARRRIGYAESAAARIVRFLPGAPSAPGPPPRRYLYRPRLWGRDEAFARASRVLRELGHPAKGGRSAPHLVAVEGEAGSGRTRFASELTFVAAARGAVVVAGECAPTVSALEGRAEASGAPFAALRDVVRAAADHCREVGPSEVARVFGPRGKVLAPHVPELAALPGQGELPDPPALTEEAALERTFDALRGVLTALALHAPHVLVLDDVHWADEASLAFLSRLLERGALDELPLCVVATYRAEESTPALDRLLALPSVLQVPLGPLADGDVARVVADMLALEPPPAGLTEVVARQSRGNPLVVAELLRASVDDGLLDLDAAGVWREAPAGSGDRAAELLERLGERRLRALDPEERELLDAAAVVGRVFELRMLPGGSTSAEPRTLGIVAGLVARQVLEDAPGGRYRFASVRLRDAVYAELDAPERRRLHAQAAASLQTLAPGERETRLHELALQLERAGDVSAAATCFLAAARRARRSHSLAQAEPLYRAAIRLAGPGIERVAAMNELGRRVLSRRGRSPEILALHERALLEARDVGDVRGESESLRCIGVAQAIAGLRAEALDNFEAALAAARRCSDGHAEVMLLGNIANVRMELGQQAEARALYEEAVARARSGGDATQLATTLGNLGECLHEIGELQSASLHYGEALAISREIDDRYSQAWLCTNYATLQHVRGDLPEARELCREARRVAHALGDHLVEASALCNLGSQLLQDGQLEAARAHLEEGRALAEQVASASVLGSLLVNLGLLHMESARPDVARELVARALGLHEAAGPSRSLAMDHVVLARLAWDDGELERAEAELSLAEELHRVAGFPLGVRSVLRERARVARYAGELARASALLEESRDPAAPWSERVLHGIQLGHAALAGGGDGEGALALVESTTRGLEILPESNTAKEWRALERAVARRREGGTLLRGELPEALGAGLRRRLQDRSGAVPP